MERARLGRYLRGHLDGFDAAFEMSPFAGGQSNPTYLINTPVGPYVLRAKPPGAHHPSAHAIDREFRVQAALRNSAVPVARMLHFCDDLTVAGRPFYVMEHLSGETFWDPALPMHAPEQRAKIYGEMSRVLAAIHSVDIAGSGLSDFGRGDGYYARQLHRWSRQYQDAGRGLDGMAALIDWLEERLPPEDGQVALVHGDYRIDNLLFDPETLRIRAVLDWELSTLGHPMADLAYQIMQRAMGRDWHLPGLAGLDLTESGIPNEETYVCAYCQRRNLTDLGDWHYAKVFAFFRFSAICNGVGARAAAGQAASADAARVAAMAQPLARMGLELACAG